MLFHPAALSWTRRFAVAAAVVGATAAAAVAPPPADALSPAMAGSAPDTAPTRFSEHTADD